MAGQLLHVTHCGLTGTSFVSQSIIGILLSIDRNMTGYVHSDLLPERRAWDSRTQCYAQRQSAAQAIPNAEMLAMPRNFADVPLRLLYANTV